MNDDYLTRRLQAICKLLKFDFGSLWFVGENIWKEKLGGRYFQREDRTSHPAICLATEQPEPCLHAAVKMWHGTTPGGRNDERMIETRKRFVIKNFDNKGDGHRTMFGHFSAVPIEIDNVHAHPPRILKEEDEAPNSNRERQSKQSRFRAEEDRRRKLKSVIVANDSGRTMSDSEKEELRDFARRFYSIG